jgi:hypothetical protein
MEKLTEASEKYSKKRKTLSFKEFVPAKKSKCIFLYFNVFRKRKMEIKEKKLIFPFCICFFSRKLKQNYMNDSTL